MIEHMDKLAHTIDVRHQPLVIGCENTPAVAWSACGSMSHQHATLALLRLQALLQHAYHTNVFMISIPGMDNTLADLCFCSFHLIDHELLSLFHSTFPTQPLGQMCHLKPKLTLQLTSALL